MNLTQDDKEFLWSVLDLAHDIGYDNNVLKDAEEESESDDPTSKTDHVNRENE